MGFITLFVYFRS